jgi:hypothetical protein
MEVNYLSIKFGKIIKTISIDNKPDLVQHIEKQTNFSSYIQKLIEQDFARLQATQQQEQVKVKIELTKDEKIIFNSCQKYFKEYSAMTYGSLYHYFPIVIIPDHLWCLLGDVKDNCKQTPTVVEYINHIRDDFTDYEVFYDKISRYWQQENPIPEDWKTEIIPGLTLHDALSKIIPEALKLKCKDLPITIKRISELAGLTYQQTYTQLMPHIRPTLKELQVEV